MPASDVFASNVLAPNVSMPGIPAPNDFTSSHDSPRGHDGRMSTDTGPEATSGPIALPTLDELRESARVVALPMAARFRGIEVREALLLRGPAGWTEFSPFAEYADAEASTWLASAIEFGWSEPPTAVRHEIGVNATVPAIAAERVPEVLARFEGCRTAKVKVAERGQSLADDIARVRIVRAVHGSSP